MAVNSVILATGHSARDIYELLHKKEIIKLDEVTSQKGCTLPCLRMYWKGGRVKVEIGVGKGKSHSDQRQDLKKRTEMREAQREMARFNRG